VSFEQQAIYVGANVRLGFPLWPTVALFVHDPLRGRWGYFLLELAVGL